MKSIRCLLVGIAFAVLAQSGLAEEKLSRAQMADDLNQLFDVMRRGYAYIDEKKDLHGVDLDRMQADALSRLDAVRSNGDFVNLIKEAIARLRDGHCEAYAGHLAAARPRAWPLLLRSVKEGVLVTGFDFSLVGSGIEIGDLLQEVNGRAIDDWIAEEARTVSASTDGARRRIALQRVTATAKDSIRVTVQHANGAKAVIAIKTGPHLRSPAEPNLADLPEGKFAVGSVLKGGPGYIRIPSFAWDTAERKKARTDAEIDASYKSARDQIDAAFEAVAGAKALVLDLRGNSGGWDNIGACVASHFLPDAFRYYTTQTRFSRELRMLDKPSPPPPDGWGPKWEWSPRKTAFSFFQGKPYTGRLLVLINEDVFSAADCLTAVLADLRPDVRFVGRPTHGGAGGPRILAKLKHSGIDVQLSTMRIWSPNGRLIEGHGTRPNVAVEWTREDVISGRDADLDAALSELSR